MIRLLSDSPLAKAFAGYLRYISEPVTEEDEDEDEGENEGSARKDTADDIDSDPFDDIMVGST
jgi:hypothetical protein